MICCDEELNPPEAGKSEISNQKSLNLARYMVNYWSDQVKWLGLIQNPSIPGLSPTITSAPLCCNCRTTENRKFLLSTMVVTGAPCLRLQDVSEEFLHNVLLGAEGEQDRRLSLLENGGFPEMGLDPFAQLP